MYLKPWLVLALAFSFVPVGTVVAADLVDPDPIAIPGELTSQQAVVEIKRALIGRGWIISREAPGRIDATLNLRAHVARIAVTHGDGQVRVAYVSSENLKYREKNGRRTIHKNYLSWIGHLVGDISRNLQTAAIS